MLTFTKTIKYNKMATKYMQANYSTGNLFEYSKEEKEGFSEHKNAKGEVKGYRKYYDEGVTGELLRVEERTNQYLNDTKELVVTIKSGDDYININFTTYNVKDTFSTFAEDVIKALPDLTLGKTYTVRPYNFVGEKGNKIVGVSFKSGKEKAKKLQQKYAKKDGSITEGVIPPVTWSEKRGKMVPDEEAKTDYLYDVYIKQLERLGGESNTQSGDKSSPSEAPEKKTAPKKVQEPVLEEDDDLPF